MADWIGGSRDDREQQERLHRMFEEYRESVFRTAYGILRNREEALDVVQDTFLKAWKRMRKLKDGPSLKGWLITVSRNLSIDRYRRRKWESPETDPESGGHTEPLDQDTRIDLKDVIQHVFPKLSDRQQQVFALRYYEDMSFGEIAETLGVAEGTVKTLHHRAITAMREMAARKWSWS